MTITIKLKNDIETEILFDTFNRILKLPNYNKITNLAPPKLERSTSMLPS